jgi:hypothetical protein
VVQYEHCHKECATLSCIGMSLDRSTREGKNDGTTQSMYLVVGKSMCVMERLKCLLELRCYLRRVEEFALLFHCLYQSNRPKCIFSFILLFSLSLSFYRNRTKMISFYSCFSPRTPSLPIPLLSLQSHSCIVSVLNRTFHHRI